MRSLSDQEVLSICNAEESKNTKMVVYRDLKELPKRGHSFLLLYRSAPNYGHWTSVLHHENGDIEAYDSYGIIPDTELHWTRDVNAGLGQEKAILSDLLRKVPERRLHFNEKHLQSNAEGDVSCGFFVGMRCLFHWLTIEEFQWLIKRMCQLTGGTPSEVVVALGNDVLNGGL